MDEEDDRNNHMKNNKRKMRRTMDDDSSNGRRMKERTEERRKERSRGRGWWGARGGPYTLRVSVRRRQHSLFACEFINSAISLIPTMYQALCWRLRFQQG